MALYTKYRPRDWDSVVSQDYITTILRNSLKSDRVGHAYLLHGSRGTGKTTSARILAKGVNCTALRDGNPCHECENCRAFDNGTMLDCIEIDGASNNGVENVRDLIEKARFEPNQGKYKVYIIDEVHMLSTGAFNALLKTLEEPPPHVKFILATTEIEKVPETIRSRTLRFDFRKITKEDIIARLEYVCKEEKITAEKEAIELIARVARGGLRDALTLLEQNTIDSEVRAEHVRYTLALIEDTLIDDIIEHLRTQDLTTILSTLETLRSGHIDARGLFEQILYRLRDLMFDHVNDGLFFEYQEVFTLMMEGHTKIKLIPDGMMLIEITFLKIVKRGGGGADDSVKDINKKELGGMRKSGESEGATLSERRGKQQSDERQQSESEFVDPSGAFGTFQSGKVQAHKIIEKEIIDSGTSQEGREQDSGSSPGMTGTGDSASSVEGWKESGFLPSQEGQKPENAGLLPEAQSDDTGKMQEGKETKNKSFSFPTLIGHFRETNLPLMTDLKMARFQTDGTKLTLIFAKSWNHGRVDTPKVKNLITESLETLFGGNWSVECRLEEGVMNISHIDDVF